MLFLHSPRRPDLVLRVISAKTAHPCRNHGVQALTFSSLYTTPSVKYPLDFLATTRQNQGGSTIAPRLHQRLQRSIPSVRL